MFSLPLRHLRQPFYWLASDLMRITVGSSGSAGLGQGLRACISSKLPYAAEAAGPQNTLREARNWSSATTECGLQTPTRLKTVCNKSAKK